MNIKIILVGLSMFFCCGLSQTERNNSKEKKSNVFKIVEAFQSDSNYDFTKPSEFFILEKKLGEISSLAYDPEENVFITNNDESGSFYFLDAKNFEIISEVDFGWNGDYESIEKVGNDVFICKSDGGLYVYNMITKKARKQITHLSSKNDVEGLCYDKRTNSLLLACKGEALNVSKDKREEKKSIYKFNLEAKKLNPKPHFTIKDSELKDYISSAYKEESKSKIKALKKKAIDFAPSGIAIHPESGDYYLISAIHSLLLIINQEKDLIDIVFLNKNTMPQPEGITFDKEKNLYISTEGHGSLAKIFKFNSLN